MVRMRRLHCMRILLADLDQELTAQPARSATGWHQVQVVRDGERLLKCWTSWHPDVVVLGTSLPGVDPFELAERAATAGIALVLLLSRGRREEDLLDVLERGVDAYIEKPVSPEVLLARIDAFARRHLDVTRTPPREVVKVGRLTVDPVWHRVTWDNQSVQLTRQQFRILHQLAMHAGQSVTHRRIIDYAWDSPRSQVATPFLVEVARLVNHVSRIRAKLQAVSPQANPIVAEPGRGYRLLTS